MLMVEELWERHFGTYDDVVFAFIEGVLMQQAARDRTWRARARRALRRRPQWWYMRKHEWWHFWRVHTPGLVERLDARQQARWERREAGARAAAGGMTFEDLRGARWRLSGVRYRNPTREAFACSDPLSGEYVGVLEASLLRERRERGGEWV